MFDDLLEQLDQEIKSKRHVSFSLSAVKDLNISKGKGILKNAKNPNYEIEIKSPNLDYESESSISDYQSSIDGTDQDIEFPDSDAIDFKKLPKDFTLPDGSESDDSMDLVSRKSKMLKVYIQTLDTFVNILLDPRMTVCNVIEKVKLENSLENLQWTLFEVNQDLGIERPIRIWENMTELINSWDINTVNHLLLKNYTYSITVSPSSITGKYPTAQGFLYLELERGKWRKRFCFLKKMDLYYLDDSKDPNSEKLFCSTRDYDVFTFSVKPKRKMPSEFAFVLKASKNPSQMTNYQEYCKFFCVEKQKSHFDWVLSLRLNRSELMFLENPDIFRNLDVPEKAWKRKEKTTNYPDQQSTYHLRDSPDSDKDLPIIGRKVSGASVENTFFSQIERKSSTTSDDGQRKDEGNKSGTKPLLSFKSGDYRTHPRHKESRELKEGEVLKKHGRVGKNKLLIDVSDANLCQVCGCSEFRGIFTGRREAQCGNCLHVHSNI